MSLILTGKILKFELLFNRSGAFQRLQFLQQFFFFISAFCALVTEAEVTITNSVRHYSVQKCICYFSDSKKENQISRGASSMSQNSIMQEAINLTKNSNIDILFEKNSDTRARSTSTPENIVDISSSAQLSALNEMIESIWTRAV
ncbi:hypothetical protein CIHG_10145 [Coccidioides immitis H538.4]|uniref:Uncharacterized protein n=1 Tax=Coccidioides immitis H538.4 TaxID=396776 RepID=A0A0J8S582_COCIT|nr:hypothetical protein CIHG_10145 [Coccidioides immitis H538.4]